MRHGRPFRAIADLTDSDAKSEARIWYGAPGTTCTAGSVPDLIRRRIEWLVVRKAAVDRAIRSGAVLMLEWGTPSVGNYG
jgi:hypothetical protein